jgi:hypothetical protein
MHDDKPIVQYVVMIDNCEAVGRKDLADQIKMYWRKFLNKYPKYRIGDSDAYKAAAKHGMNSIKAHLFGGKEFVVWLKEQEDVEPAQLKELQAVPPIVTPKDAPAIAIPKNNETQEDWLAEASRTKESLVAAKAAFNDAGEYIKYLEVEAGKIKQMIDKNKDAKKKDGTPHKLSERVPKWTAQLEATIALLEETKKSLGDTEKQFKEAVNDYNHAPILTVAYEKKTQDNLDNVLLYIANMTNLDKQREILTKLDDALGKMKITAGTEEVIAGDILTSLFTKFKDGFKALKSWLTGLNKSVSDFSKLAALRY